MAPETEFLFTTHINLQPAIDGGPTPAGHRLTVYVTGGSFEGPGLRGKVLAGGGDWLRLRADGSGALDVRIWLETDDGARIYMTYGGRLVVPPELLAQAMDFDNAQAVDPSLYYFRTQPLFETGHPAYAHLNTLVAIGVGRVGHGGVTYDIYAVK